MWRHGTEKGEVFMTFVNNNGKVPYIMYDYADHVTGEMPLETAEKIYNEGTKRASNRFPGYPVCVDNKYFFRHQDLSEEKENHQ